MPQPSKEITQLSGFDDVENLKDAMPRNVDDTGDAKPAPKTRKARAAKGTPATGKGPTPVVNPNMNDERYAKACAEMSAFGGKGLIIRGFQAGANALDDPSFALQPPEERQWDNFFYVLSKKPLFDVGSAWFLAVFFVVMLLSQLGWRVFERTEIPILQELFPNKEKREARERAKEAAGIAETAAEGLKI